MVAHACHSSHGREPKVGGSWSKTVWAKKSRPYLQNISSKKDWRYGSNSTVPVYEVQSSEFQPQYCKKKKRKERKVKQSYHMTQRFHS
jgi:hypothetical protein